MKRLLVIAPHPDDEILGCGGVMFKHIAQGGVRLKYKDRVIKVYGYETMSETGWNTPNVQNEFIPNSFVDISAYLEKKLKALQYYDSQLSPFPDSRSLESIEALAKYRGALMHMKAAEDLC